MTIIGIFYLLLIMGWVFLILVLKCKRARAKRLAEEEQVNAMANQSQPCHVIQIGSHYYDIIPVSNASNNNFNNYRSCVNECTLQQHLPSDTNNNNISTSSSTTTVSAPPTAITNVRSYNHHHHHHRRQSSHITHTNQAFIMDEGGIFPTTGGPPPTVTDLPPSYEDVMRLPTSYPKVAPLFTPTYDEIMQSEYERNARNNNHHSSRSGGPAIIEVTHNEIISENQTNTSSNTPPLHELEHQNRPHTTSNNNNQRDRINDNVV